MQLDIFINQKQLREPRTQLEAIVYFMANLDIEMVSSFLDDNKTYQYFPKYIFISKLIKTFEQFEKDGEKVLSVHKGVCSGCTKGCGGYTFLSNRTGKFLDILFKMEEDLIVDIYECSSFTNQDNNLYKNERVYIDPTDMFESKNPF